jgi:tetratricopeptide (TPR) repeat protein
MSALNELGTDDLDAGRPAQALQRFLTVLPAFRKSYGTESAYVTVVYNNIGEAQRQLGDPRSAVDSIKSALDIQSRIFGNEDPRTGLNQALYARALSEAGQLAPAREWFGRGLRTLRSGFGPKHPATARIEAEYGLFLIHTGAVTEAIDLLTKVEQTLLTSYPPASVYPTLARLYRGIGEARLGHRETARALLQTNLARLQASDHKQPLRVSEGQRVLETLDR